MTYKKKRELLNKVEPILETLAPIIAGVAGSICGFIIFQKLF